VASIPNESVRGGLEVRDKALLAKKLTEAAAKGLCFLSAAFCVVITLGIVFVLGTESLTFFQKVPAAEFFSGIKWLPTQGEFGILPLVIGTLLITFGSGLVSIPLGLLVAVYLAEYAPQKVRRIIKPALELLAGIPSVVFGYFALNLISPLIQTVHPGASPLNAASGAIVVGIMTLPLVASLCEDAISAVPKSLREGAYGIGATKTEVTLGIVVPAALSGIIAAFILALSRAIGETMAVTIAAGATPRLTLNPGDEIQTMTAYIVNTSKGDLSRGSIEYQSVFAVGITLFVLTLGMNILANIFVRKYRRVY
jgi:phosphate transport system permease protein